MSGKIYFAFSVFIYALFHLTFLYVIGFVANLFVPKSIDSGEAGSLVTAVAVNLGLLSLFAVQHTIMAREGFKKVWTQIIPAPIERSVFMLFTCLVLAIICAFWQPIPQVLWTVSNRTMAFALLAVSLAGWLAVPAATFMLDHFEFTGLRQTWNNMTGAKALEPTFKSPGLYRIIRHPMLLGVLIAIWATPTMTVGHLLFAAGMSLYIAIGVRFEERSLVAVFGDQYRDYQERVPMLIPGIKNLTSLKATDSSLSS